MQVLGFALEVLDGVYSPREDTLLLARNIPPGKRVLELGCGSGLACLCAAKKAEHVLGIDINPAAVRCSRENAKQNHILNCEFKESDLFSDVKGEFDVLLFNAPYLPKKDRFDNGPEALAWCGGETGREVISRFADECRDFLAPKGTIALIASSLTGLEPVLERLRKNGLSPFIADREKLAFEELYCIHAKRRG